MSSEPVYVPASILNQVFLESKLFENPNYAKLFLYLMMAFKDEEGVIHCSTRELVARTGMSKIVIERFRRTLNLTPFGSYRGQYHDNRIGTYTLDTTISYRITREEVENYERTAKHDLKGFPRKKRNERKMKERKENKEKISHTLLKEKKEKKESNKERKKQKDTLPKEETKTKNISSGDTINLPSFKNNNSSYKNKINPHTVASPVKGNISSSVKNNNLILPSVKNNISSSAVSNVPPAAKSGTGCLIPDNRIEKIILRWNKISPKKKVRKISPKLKKQLLSRLAEFSFVEWKQLFLNLKERSWLYDESWFGINFVVRSQDTFQKVLDNWMDWKIKEDDNQVGDFLNAKEVKKRIFANAEVVYTSKSS